MNNWVYMLYWTQSYLMCVPALVCLSNHVCDHVCRLECNEYSNQYAHGLFDLLWVALVWIEFFSNKFSIYVFIELKAMYFWYYLLLVISHLYNLCTYIYVDSKIFWINTNLLHNKINSKVHMCVASQYLRVLIYIL